mmetsp:Transcript_45011/g.73348  ORF Transcript_45011/g.73348 Transcript_45011/m.73348 type:complete len:359 (+) Transcript_45011:169-1245(+)|eukprot:CAMPEP_0184669754 /NCGR_PEP_ID=MMETSP0308-20130426/78909_1 /TAXON_ID=38269 /ORGANISM="Gloeochaete witrockiana, Strain SAG 46.84" /LENGTH=358 /DNA_ID=CAMNT_0027116181 /DNA_START=175 /DNA_END=1251 /DNA_ORIENTATION=-
MKGLILVGGYGTRLRPLTLTVPKPLVDFANKPIVIHQIEAMVKAGVKEVVLAVAYQPDFLMAALKKYEDELGVKILFSIETEPLGTAGPLALAKEMLKGPEPFFVLNSDVICDYPLVKLLQFHKAHGKEGTILTTPVEDPSKYGVVVSEEDGKVQRFVEKPKEYVGNKINAGIYCLNSSALDRIEVRPTSIEKEVFPAMASEGELYQMVLPGFWMDIGQPKDYLSGMVLYLASLASKSSDLLSKGPGIQGNVLIDPSAKIGKDVLIGPNVTIGKDAIIEDGARLSRCAIFTGCKIKSHSLVNNSIIGWQSTVGKWAHVQGSSVLGEDVQVADEIYITGAIVLPHKGVGASLLQHQIVL